MSNLPRIWRTGYMAEAGKQNPYTWRNPLRWLSWFHGYHAGDTRRWNEIKEWLESRKSI